MGGSVRLVYQEKNLDLQKSYFTLVKHRIDIYQPLNVKYYVGSRDNVKEFKKEFEKMEELDQIQWIKYIETIFNASYKPKPYTNPIRITKNVSAWKPKIWEDIKRDRKKTKFNKGTK